MFILCVCVPQQASDAGLCEQQEAFVRRQDDAVGHVEGVQQDLHAACIRIVREKTAEAVQLDHLKHQTGQLYLGFLLNLAYSLVYILCFASQLCLVYKFS